MSENQNTNQDTPQQKRKDPTTFMVLWLGSLASFIILYAIFVHRLQ